MTDVVQSVQVRPQQPLVRVMAAVGLPGPPADAEVLQPFVDAAEAAASTATSEADRAANAGGAVSAAAATALGLVEGKLKTRRVFALPVMYGYNRLTFSADNVGVIRQPEEGFYFLPAMSVGSKISMNQNGVTETTNWFSATAASGGSVDTFDLVDSRTNRALSQVWLGLHDNVKVPLTGGDKPASLVSYSIASSIGTAVVARAGLEQKVKWRVNRIGSALGVRPRKLYLILHWGQSLNLAFADTDQEPIAPWRGDVSEHAFMFDSSAFDGIDRGPRPFQLTPTASYKTTEIDDVQFSKIVPLHEDTHGLNGVHAMSSAGPCAFALHHQHIAWEDVSISTVIGTGATNIAYFIPDSAYAAAVGTGTEAAKLALSTAHFRSMIKAIVAAKARVDAYNAINPSSPIMELEVITTSQQGEEDNSIGTSATTFKNHYASILAGLKAKILNLGGVYRGHIFAQTMQVPLVPGGIVAMATTAQADMARAGSHGGVNTYCLPIYPMLPGGNQTHLWPRTYYSIGSGFAYYIAEIRRGAYNPTLFVADGAAVLSGGNTITCTVSGGTGDLTVDTTTIPNTADGKYGLTAVDDLGALTIASVAVSGNQVVVTLSGTTDLTKHPKIRFGMAGVGQLPTSTAPRVNIRDTGVTSEWPCAFQGNIVSGWLIAHEVACT